MRLFIATDLPPSIVDSISEVRQTLDPGSKEARWIRPETMHLTLKFLGNLTPESVDMIDSSLKTIRAAAFIVSISGVGFFPNERSPRVLWVGVFSEGLNRLAAKVEQKMFEIGYARERRPYSPHLTLARGSRTNRIHRGIAEAFSGFADRQWGSFTTDRFYLYQSHLGRSGAVYEKLKEYPLQTD